MPCFLPMPAVRMKDGSVKFVSRNKAGVEGSLMLPCGQCINCRLDRSRDWAMRCMHEASIHKRNSFITLTYHDDHLPAGGSLRYRDFQLFMMRLRKKYKDIKISFYCGGEYGTQATRRPHYHACLFGFDFDDKVYFKRSKSGDAIYTSKTLNDLWGKGHCSIGQVSFLSAGYIARYCLQKVTGPLADEHYRVPEFVDEDGVIRTHLTPEFNHMSLKPAVGKRFLEKYKTNIYPRDFVIVNGVKCKPPKYYDELFEKEDPVAFQEIAAEREYDFELLRRLDPDEFREKRMSEKHEVKLAQSKFLKREL